MTPTNSFTAQCRARGIILTPHGVFKNGAPRHVVVRNVRRVRRIPRNYDVYARVSLAKCDYMAVYVEPWDTWYIFRPPRDRTYPLEIRRNPTGYLRNAVENWDLLSSSDYI